MKTVKIICIAAVCACLLSTMAYAVDPFAIKTALNTTAEQNHCVLSMSADEILEFSAADLERRMGLEGGSLQGVTVTSLPDVSQGVLYLYGVEVESYQFISRGELDELCFAPNETAVTAGLTLLPQADESVSTSLSIQILAQANSAPSVENVSAETVANTAIRGVVPASDPDGDPLSLQLIRKPEKGVVTLEGQNFLYEPYWEATGSDSFTVCAVDSYGNYSGEGTVDILIEKNTSSFFYTDMQTHPSAYAAIMLTEKGAVSGRKIGDAWFFQPDRQVTRGEFLVMLLASAGMDGSLPSTVNTGLPEDGNLPLWLKPYVKKAVDEGIWEENTAFRHEEIPTRAEAVVLTHRAAKITDVKDFALPMGDAAAIPDWAEESYKALAAYRMLDLYDGQAHPTLAVTNSSAADLLWQLWKHCHR